MLRQFQKTDTFLGMLRNLVWVENFSLTPGQNAPIFCEQKGKHDPLRMSYHICEQFLILHEAKPPSSIAHLDRVARLLW